ncbi:MAG: DUF1223 domain-containing protein [Thiobacillaceae bacterium]
MTFTEKTTTARRAPPAILLLALCVQSATAATECNISSGTTRAALFELYTSEGCSSCPPADQWLSSLPGKNIGTRDVVPLAFHVDYWDKLGWIDPFAQAAFSQRQRERNGRPGWVYTPQFMLNGNAYRAGSNGLPRAASPAQASLELNLNRADPRRWLTRIDARIAQPGEHHQVYVALYENNLVSHISAGENAQRTLHHDFVVRQLLGPFSIPSGGQFQKNLVFNLKPGWKPQDSGLAAFVQNKDGEAIQALTLPACL